MPNKLTLHPLLARTALSLALGLVAAIGHAQAPESPEAASAPAQPASSGGAALVQSIGSFFNRLRTPAPADTPATSTDAATREAPNADVAASKPASAFSVIDIDSWSSTADVVLDPQCKNMVQPFGLSDNAASLAMLAAKLKLKGFLDGLQGQRSQQMHTSDIVKLAARHLNWLPMEAEVAMGQAMLSDADILDENKNKDARQTYAQARAMLADIVKQLPQPLPYDFQLLVRTSSFSNASALPGGIVLVDRDLFKKGADLDFAYFVMAHEVAHVLQRHETRVYQARLADGIDSLEGLRKLFSGAGKPTPATMVSYATAMKKLFVNFTEAQELQADSCAMRVMAKRFPDSKLLAAKLKSIEQKLGPVTIETTDGPQANNLIEHLKYLGDGVMERHPNTSKRRGNLQAAFSVSFVAH